MVTGWEISLGFYPGILFGIRTYKYNETNTIDHVLYLPLVDLCLTIYKEEDE
tara:strand:+ start:2963 stop:3118 length:156 start_codon:yes stop_codon:yes gene_type:complete